MTIPDEVLAAYVNGELQGAERARIEQAMVEDQQLAQRVAQQRAQRERLHHTANSVLHDALPQRLAQSVKRAAPAGPAQIIDLARVRAQRARRGNNGLRLLTMRRYTIAASLVVGLMGGALIQWLSAPDRLTEVRDGSLLARGALARALNEQLGSSAASSGQVRIGTSFRARSGNYCRSFVIGGSRVLAGLACRSQEQWQVLNLVGSDAPGGAASGARPAALVQAIEERISGEPLSAAAEIKARNSGWR
jgi:hypothetical protein